MTSIQKYRACSALRAAIAGAMLVVTPHALGQSVSATLQGQVTLGTTPAPGATVTATNTATGLTRTAQSSPNGNYTLAGLPPGPYKIDVNAGGQTSSKTVTLQVGQRATLDLGVGQAAADLESVTVSATRLVEAKTSEVANYISLKEIELLPQNSRNFLQFAETVPGMQFIQSANGQTEFAAARNQPTASTSTSMASARRTTYPAAASVDKASSQTAPPTTAVRAAIHSRSSRSASTKSLRRTTRQSSTRSAVPPSSRPPSPERTSSKSSLLRHYQRRLAREGSERRGDRSQGALGTAAVWRRLRRPDHSGSHAFLRHVREERNRISGHGVRDQLDWRAARTYTSFVGTFNEDFDEDLFFGKIDLTLGDAHLFELSAKFRDESDCRIRRLGGSELRHRE